MRDALTREWLEADGLGGFASGTVAGIRTRRYHALLLTAKTPPTGRVVLVNGFDAWVETPAGRFAISSQAYVPDVTHPDGTTRIAAFDLEPWPRWTFALPDGTRVAQEIFVPKDSSAVAVSWRLVAGTGAVTLTMRPFLSGRDYHSLHHENPAFRFDAIGEPGGLLAFQPYPDVPSVVVRSNGSWDASPEWYRNFLYAEEKARGLDSAEDLASPGTFRFDLSAGEAIWLAAAEGHEAVFGVGGAEAALAALRSTERRRRASLGDRLDRAADAYLVRRGSGRTIVAGYPWFTDWGRDTFIALRGLCLATGRLAEAEGILVEWSGAVSQGMLPNFFPDAAVEPEFNSVDASLWYVVAVYDYFEAMAAAGHVASRATVQRLQDAIEAILAGYAAGTRFGIRADADGLLAAGQAGVQLTWMDAKVGDWVVTPRIGKPVEVQALWLNALWIAGAFSDKWRELHDRGLASFHERFWNEAAGCLYDVVDVDHAAGDRGRRVSPEPDLRRRRPPVRARRGRARAPDRGRRRGAARDAGRPALARAGRARLHRTVRGRPAPARRRLPPGDRLAVSRRRLRGCVGPRAGRHGGGEVRGARALSRAAAGAPRRGRTRPRFRDRRRRRAAHAARLPVPGLVGRGAAADRPGDPGRGPLKPRARIDIQGPA